MTESHLSGAPEPGAQPAPGRRRWYQRVSETRNLGVIFLFVAIVVGSAASSPVFLTPENMKSVLAVFFVELALVTMAQALVILVRGIDLSVGGVIALTVISVGFFHKAQHLDIWTATALGLLVGTCCGLLNGLLITQMHTPPIIATLGSGIMFAGISLGISGGKPYSGFPAEYQWIGQGFLGPLPVQFVILIVIAVIGQLMLVKTRWGRWVYAAGGNPVAARFSGVPVDRLLLVIYTLSGTLCAVAAIIMSGRFNSAKSTFGVGTVELMSITAALLGGVAISGGEGSIAGALLGMLVIAVLQDGMTLAEHRIVVQLTLIAVLLVVVVLVEQFQKERRIS